MEIKQFRTNVHLDHTKEMWEFLKGHYSYYTMNSWNKLKSIANNVKVYNLPFSHDAYRVFEVIQADDYCAINSMLEDFEADHPGYSVGFNGRSAGYLVLYSAEHNGNILPDFITDFDTYHEFVCYNWGDVESYYKSELKFYTKLVRDFDTLCDNLVTLCDSMTAEADEEREKLSKQIADCVNRDMCVIVEDALEDSYRLTPNDREELETQLEDKRIELYKKCMNGDQLALSCY